MQTLNAMRPICLWLPWQHVHISSKYILETVTYSQPHRKPWGPLDIVLLRHFVSSIHPSIRLTSSNRQKRLVLISISYHQFYLRNVSIVNSSGSSHELILPLWRTLPERGKRIVVHCLALSCQIDSVHITAQTMVRFHRVQTTYPELHLKSLAITMGSPRRFVTEIELRLRGAQQSIKTQACQGHLTDLVILLLIE